MNMPSKAEINEETRSAFAGLALGDPELLLEGLEARANWQERSGLDPRTFSLGVLQAIAPQVGGPKIVAAAPELMVALGLSLPEGQQ